MISKHYIQFPLTLVRINIGFLPLHAFVLVVIVCNALADTPPRPNIVFILADDLGWGSVGCYGAPPRLVRTPHIDRLAREGIRFTSAYTPSSVCTPTRYAVLTGRYCWRSFPQSILVAPLGPLIIEAEQATLASMLRDSGYSTAIVGKWHLGFGTKAREAEDLRSPLSPGPRDCGFAYYFGIPQNHGEPWGIYVENEAVWGQRSAQRIEQPRPSYYGPQFMGFDAPQRDDWTAQTVLTNQAVTWIKRQTPGKPFFLYFAAAAVHEPVTPSKESQGTSGAGLYGDWIHDLDLSVGRILEALDASGHGHNTLVIFTSDNGGVNVANSGENWRTGIRKATPPYTSLLEAVLDTQAKGFRPNGDLRGGKGSIHEGGFRVPLIARWPGVIPANQEAHPSVSLVDMVATIAEVLNLPALDRQRKRGDSVSFLPALVGKTNPETRRASVILHSGGSQFAIIKDNWKWIEPLGLRRGTNPPALVGELFDLTHDPSETTDLKEEYPELARALIAELESVRGTQSYSAPE
ncbi:MAG: arylsulfatase [Opitutaceae bacterium]